MKEDCVLRCLVNVRLHGEERSQILDAVKAGDNFLIVLEWGHVEGETGNGFHPRQWVAIPQSEVQVALSSTAGYEIISHTGIDLDQSNITDLGEVPGRRFQLPPKN